MPDGGGGRPTTNAPQCQAPESGSVGFYILSFGGLTGRTHCPQHVSSFLYHAFQKPLPLAGTSFPLGSPLPLMSHSYINGFQIATRMSPTCESWRSNLPSLSLGDSTCAGPRCRTPFSVRAVFPLQRILLTIDAYDHAACRQVRCMRLCREIPPQASNYISIICRCCDLLIVPHTICAMIQRLHGPHLRLEFGTELIEGRTTPRLLHFCILLCLTSKAQTFARIMLQPARPPITRCLHVQRIRVCQIAYQPRGTCRIRSYAARGPIQCGRPGAQKIYCLCITVYKSYTFAVADRSCATSEHS